MAAAGHIRQYYERYQVGAGTAVHAKVARKKRSDYKYLNESVERDLERAQRRDSAQIRRLKEFPIQSGTFRWPPVV